MILKNEEHSIANCLNELYNYLDEIIIIDTGSTDKTKELCAKYTNKIYDYQWTNNFGAARNFSIKFAISDWILSIDADEIIKKNDFKKLKDRLAELPSEIYGLYFERINYIEKGDFDNRWEDYVTRIFRNYCNIFFEGKVHENVDNSIIIQNKKIINSDIKLYHYGFLKNENHLEKSQQYAKIIETEINQNPDNCKLYNWLAYEYEKQKRYDKELELLQKSVLLNNKDPQVFAKIGILYGARFNNPVESLKYFIQAEILHNTYPSSSPLKKHDLTDLYISMSKNYFFLNDLNNSEKYFNKSLELDENNDEILSFGIILNEKLNRLDKSIFFQRKICQKNKSELNLMNLASLYLRNNNLRNAQKILYELLEINKENELALKLLNKISKLEKK